MLRRAVARGVLAHLEGGSSGITSSSSSMCALPQQLQHTAGFAKKSESTVDGRLQKVLKALERQEVEAVQVSEEDYLEGMRRWAKGRVAAAAVARRPVFAAAAAAASAYSAWLVDQLCH